MTSPSASSRTSRCLQAERLYGEQALQEAQRLRYRVFSTEFGARLQGAESGLDVDTFDAHCMHIGVRDRASGQLVATTRLLDQQAARRLGGFYSEQEFCLQGLTSLDAAVLEVGRTCVDADYRNGATIAVLWGALADILNKGNYQYLMGCVSIPMRDGGIQAQAITQRLLERHPASDRLQAEPRNPLPFQPLPGNVIAEMPPLLKAYLRLGARVCGAPCWDQEFQSADIMILLRRDELCPRYARHFKTAV